jgi:hypothetical protein
MDDTATKAVDEAMIAVIVGKLPLPEHAHALRVSWAREIYHAILEAKKTGATNE